MSWNHPGWDNPDDITQYRGLAGSVTTWSGASRVRDMLDASFSPEQIVHVEMQPHMIPYVKPEGVASKATEWGVVFSGKRKDVAALVSNNRPNMDYARAVFKLFL